MIHNLYLKLDFYLFQQIQKVLIKTTVLHWGEVALDL
jgi:hypothetical protein